MYSWNKLFPHYFVNMEQQSKLQFFFETFGDECFVCEGKVDVIKYDQNDIRGDFKFVKEKAIDYTRKRIEDYQSLLSALEQENIREYEKNK